MQNMNQQFNKDIQFLKKKSWNSRNEKLNKYNQKTQLIASSVD
jgi:hypothetical protein